VASTGSGFALPHSVAVPAEMMLKRAGIRRANLVFSSLDDWQAAIIRAELKAELARKGRGNATAT
jgi:hypothetical protein